MHIIAFRILPRYRVASLMWRPDVFKHPNEGNPDEATQQATAAPVAAEKKSLDVQRTRIISLLRLRAGAVRPSWKELDPELQWHFQDGLVHHPLIVEHVTASRIPDINESYRKKKVDAQQAERDGDWEQLIWIYEKPYRIKPLRKALRVIGDPKEAARLVGLVWTGSENIRQKRKAWLSIWTKLADPWAAMDEKEQAEFATLPDRLTIFRGHGGRRRGLTQGLSWTMDQAEAEWFARHFQGPPFVASGWVFKRDVFAYFTRRDESEIVVSPDDLTVTKILPLPAQGQSSRAAIRRAAICGPHFTIADITGMVTVDFCGWAPEHLTHLRRWHSVVSACPSAKA
jgi:hypothetical protein